MVSLLTVSTQFNLIPSGASLEPDLIPACASLEPDLITAGASLGSLGSALDSLRFDRHSESGRNRGF